ncbi:TIGR03943 family protein [Paenibacillus sp. sptzw28]|uniref:TIGR03943 family putative permease subunit n=1 Tax=Paenibacillus sp. sptzw28 TaxID=715179 RepID=UPI001C6EE79D|nr:TIGR03943 family protein [Paenibacillus sp. sptzw28]QYR19431.1 TIGR03943 family protein [Paenibacillus sp. sptzw28]
MSKISKQQQPIHGAVQSLILLGFGLYIHYLVFSGHINFYIAPRMQLYVVMAGIGLDVMALYHGMRTFRKYAASKRSSRDSRDPGNHKPAASPLLRSVLINLFFLFPILLGFLTPDRALGSSLAAKKGINLGDAANFRQAMESSPLVGSGNPIVGIPSDQKLAEMFPKDEYSGEYANLGIQLFKKPVINVQDTGYVEVLSALQMYMDNFTNKPIEINGFVYREEGMKPNQFVIARFNIQCCAADAMPLGILVESDKAASYATNSWVHVSGKLGKSNYSDAEVLSINADGMNGIPAPKNVYVQPQSDFSFVNRM